MSVGGGSLVLCLCMVWAPNPKTVSSIPTSILPLKQRLGVNHNIPVAPTYLDVNWRLAWLCVCVVKKGHVCIILCMHGFDYGWAKHQPQDFRYN